MNTTCSNRVPLRPVGGVGAVSPADTAIYSRASA